MRKLVGFLAVCLLVLINSQDLAVAQAFNKGDIVEVQNTNPICLAVRDSPAGREIENRRKCDGTRGMVLDGPRPANFPNGTVTYIWWKIRWGDDGLEAWSAEGDPTRGVAYLKKVFIPPSSKFTIGNRVRATATLNARSDPPELAFIIEMPSGATGTVVGGPFYGVPKGRKGFYHFWKVDYGSGTVGWSAENWLEKITATLPTVETMSATDITATAATLNARIINDGGSTIIERRFDWGTNPNALDQWTSNVTVSGNNFSYRLTGLQPNTTYYFRSWAKNSAGWGKGSILSFSTPPATTRTLTIASSNPNSGVFIAVSSNDNNGQGSGTTQFTRTYNQNTIVTLTAPSTAGGNNFQKWQRNGVDYSATLTTTVTMDANYTMTAIYVTAPQNPILEVTPSSLNFGDVIVNQCSANQSFTVRNAGGGTLSGSATANAPFNIVSGASFNLGPNQPAQVIVRFCPTAIGPANGNVNFTSNGGNTSRSVSGNGVSQPPPGALLVTPSDGLSSSGPQGGPFAPPSKLYTLKNTGSASINWSASKGQPWVNLSKTSGTLGPGASDWVGISINSDANNLSPGSYSDMVSFTNTTNGNGNTTRSVNLAVGAPQQADLVVTSLSADPETPNSGQIVTFTVTVQNQGQAVSSPFKVSLAVGGTTLPNQTVPGLSVGQSTPVQFPWTASCTQGSNPTVDIMAIADVHNEVPESNEGNNTRSGTIVVNCSLRELIVGQLMIKADRILLKSDGIYEAQGNITINDFIRTTALSLKIDTKKLRVEGEGKIILPAVRFLGDLTLFEGKFVLGANPPEFLFSSAVPAGFQIGKLGVEISKLRLSLDGVEGTFSVIIPNIRVPDGTSKIKIEDLMISRSAGIESISLELENISLVEGFVLRTLKLNYDRESDSWSAQGQLEIPLPKGCILLNACLLLDASVRVQSGIIDQIGLGVYNFNQPIMAAVFLQKLALEADGLAPGPPPIKLTGSVSLTAGPKIHDMHIIRVDGTGSIDATGRIELGAVVFVLSDEGQIASATVILDPASGLSISGELNLASIFVVRGTLVLDLSSNFQGQLQGSAKFPKNWYLIGNREFNLVTAYVDNTIFYAEISRFTVVYTRRKDVNCWFDWGNWHVGCNLSKLQSQTMGPSALSAGSTREELVVVPPGLPFVVFWATGSSIELSLIDPAGKTITKETARLDPQKYLYSENPEIAEVYFLVNLPQPGTWKLLISRDTQLSADLSSQDSGGVELQVLAGNKVPSLTIVQPARLVRGKKIKIEWKANDDDPNASLSLFYDKDNKGADGQLIVAGLPATNGKYEWDTQQVPNGTYYIYGVVNDGYNALIISYSKGRVEVKNAINVLIGDANQDGVVDNRDVQDINAAKASLLIACDVNKPIGTCDDKDASLISQALDANGNLKPLSKRPISLNSLHKRRRIGQTVSVIMPPSSASATFTVQGIPILVNTLTARGSVMIFEALHQDVASIGVNVFDLSGRRVFSADSSSGARKIIFSGHDQQGRILGNGVYLYVVRVRGYDGREYVSEVRKLVILR